MRVVESENDKRIKVMGYDLIDEYRQAVELAEFNPNEQILDVATGSGRMAATLSLAGYSVISGDIDPEALRKTRTRLIESGLDGVTLIELDATRIPFDNRFASVICANAIHHMADPILAISEMVKACTHNGRLIIIEFNNKGFEVIETVRKSRNEGKHEKGLLDSHGIQDQLESCFLRVDHRQLQLNNVWIAQDKRLSR